MGPSLPDTSLLFDTAACTHPGARGSENQDALLAGSKAGIWAVADGIGGHTAGSHASRTLIGALQCIPPQESAASLLRACEAHVLQTSDRLARMAAASGTTIGTTLAAFLAHGEHYACVWAGDSRIYRIRPGRAELISHDHTEVQDLVDQGLLSESEGRTSPRRNVITRAIGVSEVVELEMTQGLLRSGDIFLLCSDGLTNYVEDEELLAAVMSRPLEATCRVLVELALQRDGADNITVVITRYRGPAGGPLTDLTVLTVPLA